ncbi:hypothetical protein, partial [Rhizobium leguminosarum]|uniref:hypothetical protein n=1 Tax=Rhizobium leguminosarum TaxID=384 RepID=UPI003F971B4B
ALQIDFSKDNVPSRRGDAPHAPEANVSDPLNARNQQAQEEAQRRSRRGAAGEQTSRGPTFSPANDASGETIRIGAAAHRLKGAASSVG